MNSIYQYNIGVDLLDKMVNICNEDLHENHNICSKNDSKLRDFMKDAIHITRCK